MRKSIRYRLKTRAANRRNERNQKIIDAGKLPRRDRVAAEVKSRTPIYRNRINPAHGNKHREDARLARTQDKSLAQRKAAREYEISDRIRDFRESQDRTRDDGDDHPRPARTAPEAPARVRPPVNHGAESRAEAAGRDMHDRQAEPGRGFIVLDRYTTPEDRAREERIRLGFLDRDPRDGGLVRRGRGTR